MNVSRNKITLVVFVTLLILTFLTGCATGNKIPATQPAENIAPAPETSDSTNKITPTTIRIGVSGTPELDPAVGNMASSSQAMINLYDTLVFTPINGEVEPRLAESWTVEDAGQTHKFVLRQGVKFHDGSEVEAEDVKFSIERFLAIGQGYSYVFKDLIESVEVQSKYEVVFKLKFPMGAFPNSLVRLAIVNKDLVMEHIDKTGPYGEFGDYGTAWLVTNDAGSGPYKAVELVQQDYFHAVKFDDWYQGWSERPNAPTAFRMMAVVEPSTVRTMMATRELEITDPWQSTENLNAMAEIEGVSIGKTNTLLMQNMYLNTTKPPFDDVNYRRAILSLFDYQGILDNIFPGSVLSTGPVSSGVNGHADTNVATFDIEKAKQFISQSKYADTYQTYTLDMMVNTDVADMEKIGLMFQSAASQLGIKVEISKAPWVSIVDRMATAESTPHLFSANSAPAYNDAGTYLESRYSSKNNGSWEQGEWLQDKDLDNMIQEAVATVDETERNEKYAEIQRYIVEDISATGYLCDLTERLAYQSSYVSWPLMENASDGIARSLYGFIPYFADLSIYPEKKP